MFNYLIYGWKVQTDYELRQLPAWNRIEDEQPDLTITAGDIATEFVDRKQCFADVDEHKTYFSNYMVRMIIENGNLITYEILEGANPEYVNAYFIGWGMTIVAFQKGQTAIHCSALANEKGAIFVSGRSGSGKSTLCTHFLEEGFSFMADDVAVTDIDENGRAIAYPTFPYQKLCRNVIEEKGYDYSELLYVDEDKDKFLVPIKNKFQDKPTPLKCLIFLSKSNEEEVICREVTGFEKFFILNKATFINSLFLEKNMPPKAGALCLDLAGAIRVFSISRPADKDTQAEVNRLADEIIRNL